MKNFVRTDLELCVGCEKCEEQCPIIGANIIFSDEYGNPKVKTDGEKCVACGRCVPVCPQKARYYARED